LGIAGTLLGALGGAAVQGRAARRQAAAQEEIEVRHRVRDERRAAFAGFLEHCNQAKRSHFNMVQFHELSQPRGSRELPDNLQAADRDAVEGLTRAGAMVAITGPDEIHRLMMAILEDIVAMSKACRNPDMTWNERRRQFNQAADRRDAALGRFIQEARNVLSAPDRPRH
jgi:hypothetical protein